MTRTTTTVRWSHTGNGVTAAFSYDNRIFHADDLDVYVDGVLKTRSTHYTVSGVGEDAGGNVTFTAGNIPAASAAILIIQDTPQTQETDQDSLGDFDGDVNEDALDRLTALIQRLGDRLGRALRQPDTDAAAIPALPAKASRLGKILGFNATTGDPEMQASAGNLTLPVAVADGGTGATTAAAAATNLGLGTGDSPQFTGVNVGHATDTTVTRAAAGKIAVEGKTVLANGDGGALTSGGYSATPFNAGTKSSGTFTPDEANGNLQYAVNGGAHTLAPPTNNCSIIIQYTNNGSAGAITTSGFTKVTGSTISTTNGDDFLFYIVKLNGFSHLHVQALQ